MNKPTILHLGFKWNLKSLALVVLTIILLPTTIHAQCTTIAPNGGPWGNLNTAVNGNAPCGTDCGTTFYGFGDPLSGNNAPFGVYGGEGYWVAGFVPGTTYNFSICPTGNTILDANTGADSWEPDIVVAEFGFANGVGNIIAGTIAGCSLNFTPSNPLTDTLIFIINNPLETCGTLYTVDNGIPQLTTDCNSATGGACACDNDAVCEIGESYCFCAADCDCSEETTPSFVLYDPAANNGAGGFVGTTNPTGAVTPQTGPLFCPEFVSGELNDGDLLYLGLAIFGPDCVPTWGATATEGTLLNFDLSDAQIFDGDVVHWLAIRQSEIAASAGTTTITFTDPLNAGCVNTLLIDWADFGNVSTLATDLCPAPPCVDNGVCSVGESYCSCGQEQGATPDCPCSQWTDANGWDVNATIRPVVVMRNNNGFFGLQPDPDSIALYQAGGFDGPLLCQSDFGDENTGDTVTLLIGVFDNLPCIGSPENPYMVTASTGSFFTSGTNSVSAEDDDILLLDLTTADIAAGFVNIDFTDPLNNVCTASMTIDFNWFGNPNTLIADNCPVSNTCPETILLPNAIASDLYEASNSIVATGAVVSGGVVTLQAGITVDMGAGFEVPLTANFCALIDSCGAMNREMGVSMSKKMISQKTIKEKCICF